MLLDAKHGDAFKLIAQAEEIARELSASERAQLSMALVRIAFALDRDACAFAYGRGKWQ